MGKEGTTFILAFTPVEYGKVKAGKLIIQTHEMYWSYMVRGNFPKYKVPDAKKTIDNRLSADVNKMLTKSRMGGKNYLHENIKNTSKSTVLQRNRSRSKSPKKDDGGKK